MRWLRIAIITVFLLLLVPSARATDQLPAGVEHLVGKVGKVEVHALHVAPGAPVEIKAMLSTNGYTPSQRCANTPGCVAVVNADYFTDGLPDGGMVADGMVLKMPMSPNPHRQQLSLTKTSCFFTEAAWPADVWQSTGASFTVLKGGQPVAINVLDDPNHFVYGHHSRTLIGWRQNADGSCDKWFVTVSAKRFGIALNDSGRILQSLGATDGVNMDGGSSTAMVIGSRLVSPAQDGQEHPVANLWMILGAAQPPPPPTTTTTVPTTIPPIVVKSVPVANEESPQLAVTFGGVQGRRSVQVFPLGLFLLAIALGLHWPHRQHIKKWWPSNT